MNPEVPEDGGFAEVPKVGDREVTVEQEPIKINQEMREKMLEYLRGCSDKAVGGNIELATDEEMALGERLLLMKDSPEEFPQRQGYVGHYPYTDSNFRPDAALRDEKMAEAGLDKEQVELIRQEFKTDDKGPLLKMINLTRVEKQRQKIGDVEGDDRVTFKIVNRDLPGGVLFFGKVDWQGDEAKYVPLTAEEKATLEKYLESKGK